MADGEREVRYHARIRDLPASARPRERLRDAGAGALADQELLAILLRTGTAQENAVAVASRLHGHVDDSVQVRLPGGELMIEWDGEGVVYLEGPVAFVFESRWEGAE